MTLIIAGSRTITDPDLIDAAVSYFEIDLLAVSAIMQGGAPGIDTLAVTFANARGIPVVTRPADWTRYGKGAGPIRNAQMVREVAEGTGGALLAIWDGASRGTADAIEKAYCAGLPVYVWRTDANSESRKL